MKGSNRLHAPGPWKQEGRHVEAFDGPEVIFGCEVYGPEDEAIANARLISVAPDLLEACKALLDGGPDCGCGAEGHVCGWPKVKQQAEAAIARAEGQEVTR